jgi:spermidine dehydrogenase
MTKKDNCSDRRKRVPGIDRGITRRDFLNASLLGAGALLLELPSPLASFAQTPRWDGYGGLGDYAASHGDTEEVVRVAHTMRDGRSKDAFTGAVDTGEVFDLVVVGGGLSGLGAAYHFKKMHRPGQKCLIFENHPVFGGEAKRNEFLVNGQRLIGPQGSNSFIVIDQPNMGGYEIFSELGIPTSFQYREFSPAYKQLRFDRTSYGFMLWHDIHTSVGYFFKDRPAAATPWALDIWKSRLEGAPFPADVKKDFLTWRDGVKRYYDGDDFEQWLDTMTYKDYIEKIMGLDPAITRFVDPVLASSIGLGCDAISAFGAYQVAMPGFQGFMGGYSRLALIKESDWHSFPGGNDGMMRHLVKALIPGALHGSNRFEDILNQRINFDALDRSESSIRMRIGATVTQVRHDSGPEKSDYVRITYVKAGKPYRLKACSVVVASGSTVTRRMVDDLPGEYVDAFSQFSHSAMLVVNVAVTNWSFLYRLGITAARWFEGFGFSCNIRRPMVVGDYQPPLDPEKPAIITFYVPFYYPGLPLKEQGVKGRMELLSTSYSAYEMKIKEQMLGLFGKAGFDPQRDIAGIILNRWGHAFVNPQPGFFFGGNGYGAPRHLIRKRFGRIAFGHSELNGHQHWVGAIEEGRRAAKQAMSTL